MVQFNELRITPDNKELIIDVSVKDLDIYTNVYLDYIMIDNQDTFIEDILKLSELKETLN